MDEWDVVNGIFLHDDMESNKHVTDAMQAEADGLMRVAQEYYKDAIKVDPSRLRADFYYESYFKCFSALAEWEKLPDEIESIVDRGQDPWQWLWKEEWVQQRLLPWYIRAGMRNILNGSDRKLFAYLNESLKDYDKADYLKLNFSEELAILSMVQDNYDLAKIYLDSCVKNFLENWSHLNPLYSKLRTNQILRLQNVADAILFLAKYNETTALTYEDTLREIATLWERTFSSLGHLDLNETKTVYRSQYVASLKSKVDKQLGLDDRRVAMDMLDKCYFRLNLNLIENSLEQSNYYIARKHLKLVRSQYSMFQEDIDVHLMSSKILFLRSKCQSEVERRTADIVQAFQSLPGMSLINFELLNRRQDVKQSITVTPYMDSPNL